MKRYCKENQVIVCGYVGSVDVKTDSLVSVGVANRINQEETEWVNLTFTNPQEGFSGPNFADLAKKISVGQYIVAVANERKNGEYVNYYVAAFEYGPRRTKEQ
jgi:hypothetical protein